MSDALNDCLPYVPGIIWCMCVPPKVYNGTEGMELLCGDSDIYSHKEEWEFLGPHSTVTAQFSLVCDDAWKAPMLASYNSDLFPCLLFINSSVLLLLLLFLCF